jgi:ubiquinone/menaquinone biosynthesis C-methylase UbiE
VFSLNHVVSPPQTLREIARVLRPGGRFVLVLDDLAPRWRELPGLVWKRQLPLRTPLRKLLGGWPLQSDHLRITDAELAEWTEGLFDATARSWRGPYLVHELARRD